MTSEPETNEETFKEEYEASIYKAFQIPIDRARIFIPLPDKIIECIKSGDIDNDFDTVRVIQETVKNETELMIVCFVVGRCLGKFFQTWSVSAMKLEEINKLKECKDGL